MPISFVIKEKKKQQYLIFALLAIVLITAAVLWFGFFSKRGQAPSETSVAITRRDVNINFGFLQSQALKDLIPFEPVPPLEGATGRSNPFLPY